MLTMPLKRVIGAAVQVEAEKKELGVAAPVMARALSWLPNLLRHALTAKVAVKVTRSMFAVARAMGLAGDFAIVSRTETSKASIRFSLEQLHDDLTCRKLTLKTLIRLAQNHKEFLDQKRVGFISHLYPTTHAAVRCGSLFAAVRLTPL